MPAIDRSAARTRGRGVRARDDALVDADGRGPEDAADDGAAAQRFPRGCVEEVDARRDDAVHRVRDRELRESLGRGPAAVLPLEGALLDQHRSISSTIERVPLGAREDRLADVLGGPAVAEQRVTSSVASPLARAARG